MPLAISQLLVAHGGSLFSHVYTTSLYKQVPNSTRVYTSVAKFLCIQIATWMRIEHLTCISSFRSYVRYALIVRDCLLVSVYS